MRLLFVRHGQASFGKTSYDRLSKLGLKQVKHLARYWSDLGETFDQIYVGSLRRQKETADSLLNFVEGKPTVLNVDDAFNEYSGDP